MTPQHIKTKLRAGESVFGTMISLCRTPDIALILAHAGMDFVLIDTEHGAFSTETVADLCRACRSVDLTAIVRIPGRGPEHISRTLDIGADGLMVPHVDTREEAAEIVRWAKYQPEGERGLSLTGAQTGWRGGPSPEAVMADQNAATLLVLQIESRAGIANIEGIVSVPNVDVCLVGPNDLSASYGYPGRWEEPEVDAAIQHLTDACRAAGVAAGIHPGAVETCRQWRDRGMTFLPASSDAGLLASAARASAEAFWS